MNELQRWLTERADWHYRMAAYCLTMAFKSTTSEFNRDSYIDDAQNLAREGRLFELLSQQ